MEFAFDINELLPDDITLVDGKVAPFRGKHTRDRFEFSTKQAELKKVIDMTGEASARAQGLRSPITSAMKLSHSDHKLYISKDASANSGKGAVVGLIKIGYKRLFLLDYQGNQHEVNPLCVLDFYVHESRQRKGCGKSLFQHFLKMEGIEPHMLAIDRPSPKFLSFLKKHYNLDKSIPQVNNFVVFVEFFRDLQAVNQAQKRNQQTSSGRGRPPVHPYKRNGFQNEYLLQRRQNLERAGANSRQESAGATHRSTTTDTVQRESEAFKDITLPSIVPRPPGRHSASRSRESSAGSGRWVLQNSLNPQPTPPLDAFNAARGCAARATSYSRHSLSREGSGTSLTGRRAKQDSMGGEAGAGNVVAGGSGGKRRTLHMTSSGNPFYVGTSTVEPKDRRLSPTMVTDQNANTPSPKSLLADNPSPSTVDPRFISPSGNYSVSRMYDTYYGKKPSFGGTGWNIFGVSGSTSNNSLSKPQPRTFPY